MFRPFQADHLTVLVLVFVASAGLAGFRKRLRQLSDDRAVRYPFAFFLTAAGITAWIYHALQPYFFLPLELCDFTLAVLIGSLLQPDLRLVRELAFFWGLAGSSQALLTPDLAYRFPSFPWMLFFTVHAGTVLGAVYLMVRAPLRLETASVGRVWAVTNAYAALMGLVNWRLGTNFGYLAAKPSQPSFLDYLGPWPYYLIAMEIMALAFFFLCYKLSKRMEK